MRASSSCLDRTGASFSPSLVSSFPSFSPFTFSIVSTSSALSASASVFSLTRCLFFVDLKLNLFFRLDTIPSGDSGSLIFSCSSLSTLLDVGVSGSLVNIFIIDLFKMVTLDSTSSPLLLSSPLISPSAAVALSSVEIFCGDPCS